MNAYLWSAAAGTITTTQIAFVLLGLITPGRTYCTIGLVATFVAGMACVLSKDWFVAGWQAVLFTGYALMWWKHRNDDDDDTKNGRRLKAWARNRLKVFKPVALRPAEKGAGA